VIGLGGFAISSPPHICCPSFSFISGVAKRVHNLDVKSIFAGSHTEHPWRCSKDFDLDFPLTKTKSEKKMCILNTARFFSLYSKALTYVEVLSIEEIFHHLHADLSPFKRQKAVLYF